MVKWPPYLPGGWVGNRKYVQCLVLCMCLQLLGTSAYGQRRAWNWYFGNEAAISFATGIPIPLTDSRMRTEEGCASISDPATGSLLFYTDGRTVWNRFHQMMPNGFGMHGDPSTSQSALIVQLPISSELYAIFTPAPITSADPGGRCLCLKYSIVDMRRDAGFGDVVLRDELLEQDVTEHVTAIPDCSEPNWWIVARKRSTSSFVAFHVTQDGINPRPVVSNIVGLPEIRDAGQMFGSPDGRFLVITSPSGTTQLFRFHRATGRVFRGINVFGPDNTGIHYGVTFSRDSRFLYVASSKLTPQPSVEISRFDISSENEADVMASRMVVAVLPGNANFTPLQLGPDGIIYVGRYGERFLSSIPNPSAATPTLRDTAVVLFGECRSGLPNVVNWYLADRKPEPSRCVMPIAISADRSVCEDQCIQLVDASEGMINSWSWSIPEGTPSSSRLPSPVVCFSSPGVYTAYLTVSNQYGDDTDTISITVHPKPTVVAEQTVTACSGVPVQLSATGASTYRWTPATGLNDPTKPNPVATVTANTTYTVVGTDSWGCSDTAIVNIVMKTMESGPDVTVCSGATAQLQARGADHYEWTPSTGLDDPFSATPKATVSETTTYTVRMTSGNCVVEEQVHVFVSNELKVSIDAPRQACIGASIQVRAIGGGSNFTWSGIGVQPSATNETIVAVTGSTWIYVTTTSGSCVARDSFYLAASDGPSVDAGDNILSCSMKPVTLRAHSSATTFVWSPREFLETDTGSVVTAFPTETTVFYVKAIADNGCIGTDSVVVIVTPLPAVDAGPVRRICKGSAIRLSASGSASSYTWFPSDGLDDPNSLTPLASPLVTTTYVITAEKDGCISTDSTTVYVSDINLQVPTDTRICQGSATPLFASGAAMYAWSPTTGLSDPSIPNPIASPKTTTTYRIVGTDASGCEDVAYCTVYVIDTASIKLRAATVTAAAGTSDLPLPIIVDADPEILPVFADTLRASLVFPADVYYPSKWDIGPSFFAIRGHERIVRLIQYNVQIVNPQQRINTLYGTVLAGTITDAKLHWEDIQWQGVECPSGSSTSGRLLVTGCNLQGRSLRFFSPTTVNVVPRTTSDVLDVHILGTEPGTFTVQLVSVNGNVITEQQYHRPIGTEHDLHVSLNANGLSAGTYFVVVHTPQYAHVQHIVWLP